MNWKTYQLAVDLKIEAPSREIAVLNLMNHLTRVLRGEESDISLGTVALTTPVNLTPTGPARRFKGLNTGTFK